MFKYFNIQYLCPYSNWVFIENLESLLSSIILHVLRWNFEKILIDQSGQPFRRYSAATEVEEIIPDIEALVGVKRA